MISLGSLELVVFMDQVNLRDLGLTSVDLLNLEDSLEKNEVLAEFKLEVS